MPSAAVRGPRQRLQGGVRQAAAAGGGRGPRRWGAPALLWCFWPCALCLPEDAKLLLTTTTALYTTRTTVVAPGADDEWNFTWSRQTLAVTPWRPHPEHGDECTDRFLIPPAPEHATDYNGIRLPDACFLDPGPHHVFVIGDWGGVLDADMQPPPVPADRRANIFPTLARDFVTGADDVAQLNVAREMRRRSATHPPEYILNLGDAFYWGGVLVRCGGPVDGVRDFTGQWQHVFEDVYRGGGLEGKQWLGVLGNHDFGGFLFTRGWDQMIGYTWTSAHPSTGRWLIPALYWTVTVRYPGFSVEYFFVDTNVFDAFAPDDDGGHNMCSAAHNGDGATCGLVGPASAEECPRWFQRLWDTELAWLESGLNASKAEWQVVVTHFPPEDGLEQWSRLSAAYGIDLIVSGHRHQQEVHADEPGNVLGPTAVIVSGGGGGITSESTPSATGEDDQYGFMDLTLTRDEIMVVAISHRGQIRSTTCLRPRLPGGALKPPLAASLCDGVPSGPQPLPMTTTSRGTSSTSSTGTSSTSSTGTSSTSSTGTSSTSATHTTLRSSTTFSAPPATATRTTATRAAERDDAETPGSTAPFGIALEDDTEEEPSLPDAAEQASRGTTRGPAGGAASVAPTATGGGGPPTATTAEGAADVEVVLEVLHVDYRRLIAAAPELRRAFDGAIAAVLAEAGGVSAGQVLLTLYPGSVLVRARIAPPRGGASRVVAACASDPAALGRRLASRLAAVPGIGGVATGTVAVDGLRVVRPRLGNGARPGDAHVGVVSAGFAGLVGASLAASALAAVAYFAWARPSPGSQYLPLCDDPRLLPGPTPVSCRPDGLAAAAAGGLSRCLPDVPTTARALSMRGGRAPQRIPTPEAVAPASEEDALVRQQDMPIERSVLDETFAGDGKELLNLRFFRSFAARAVAAEGSPAEMEGLFQALVQALREDLACEEALHLGLTALCEATLGSHAGGLARKDAAARAGACEAVVAALDAHPESGALQGTGCGALRVLCAGGGDSAAGRRQLAAAAGAAQAVERALLCFPGAAIQEQACGALCNFCRGTDPAAGHRRQQAAGAIPALCAALRANGSRPDVVAGACAALRNACLGQDAPGQARKQAAAIEEAIESVVALLAAHPESVAVQEAGCGALGNLCSGRGEHGSQRRRRAADAGAVPLVVRAMLLHHGSAAVQEDGRHALRQLVSESAALRDEALRLGADPGCFPT